MNTTRASLRSDLTLLTQLGLLEARPRVGYYYNQSRQGYDIYMKMIQMSVEDYQSMPVVVNEKASAYDALVSLFTITSERSSLSTKRAFWMGCSRAKIC